jgi:hypothetical protein
VLLRSEKAFATLAPSGDRAGAQFRPRYLIRGRPQPRSCFFEQPVFEAVIGYQILQAQSLGAQVLHLASIRLAGPITGQPLLANLEEFLQPAVIQALGDVFLAAKFSNAAFAKKARQTIQIFCSEECSFRVARGISFITFSAGAFVNVDFFIIFNSNWRKDEPQTLR